jgi:hypothetical protein
VLSAVYCLLAALLLAGCSGSKWSFVRNTGDNGRFSGEIPSAAQLVEQMNQNAQRIVSLECPDLDMDVKQGIQQFGLRGKLVCAKPRNFRLVAEAIGKRQADIGSNDQEFWYWIAKAEPPYLIHCSHEELARGVPLPFPFQPEWVMEALGMSELDPTQPYRVVPVQRGNVELVRDAVSQGQRVQKVTIFGRNGSYFYVRGHVLRDMNNREMCAAHILDIQNINGALVPRKIVLAYPAERMELKMTLYADSREIALNKQFDREQMAWLFTRPVLTGVQSYDLARRSLDASPGQLRPAGGLVPR